MLLETVEYIFGQVDRLAMVFKGWLQVQATFLWSWWGSITKICFLTEIQWSSLGGQSEP
jgi:hypothetical protein